MYTLYYSPATASTAVHWLLIELGVPFELVPVDIGAKAHKSPEFLRINPNGHVPVLVIDGVPYTECAALLMLLAERHPTANLSPAVGTAERSAYLQTMFYLANTLQPAYRSWFYPEEAAGIDNVDAAKLVARAKIEQVWTRLDSKFEDGRLHSRSAPHRRRFSGDDSDALVAQYAQTGNRVPKPCSLCRPHAQVAVASRGARARKSDRLDLRLDIKPLVGRAHPVAGRSSHGTATRNQSVRSSGAACRRRG